MYPIRFFTCERLSWAFEGHGPAKHVKGQVADPVDTWRVSDTWCRHSSFHRPLCTRWVKWSTSRRPPSGPRYFSPATHFRLVRPGSRGQLYLSGPPRSGLNTRSGRDVCRSPVVLASFAAGTPIWRWVAGNVLESKDELCDKGHITQRLPIGLSKFEASSTCRTHPTVREMLTLYYMQGQGNIFNFTICKAREMLTLLYARSGKC